MRNLSLKLNKIILPLIIFSATFIFQGHTPEEGMFPLSEISKLDLKSAGLKIGIDDIYNPNGVSLIDALVKVGGCTGSFVSDEGLILTNHHCSFDIIRQASTVENNYLENGFIAKTKGEEFPAKGLTCQITESYEDVSSLVLGAAEGKDPEFKRSAIRDKINEIKNLAEKENPNITAEVSEMFVGKTYILFKYKTIKDIRLVMAPPRSIGEFGGETDNWVWPRHTGDFSFLRAYVAPDGKAATYSKENVPFKPKKFLKVNQNGVKEGDFLFILGYPGRTYRHYPAAYLEYHQGYQLPFIQKVFSDIIAKYEELGTNDPKFALAVASTVKSMANAEKNYRGKLLGMHRLSLVENKRTEDIEMQGFINNTIGLKGKYGNLISDIDDSYKVIKDNGRLNLAVNIIRNYVAAAAKADYIIKQTNQNSKPDSLRGKKFTEAKKQEALKSFTAEASEMDITSDSYALYFILREIINAPEAKDIAVFAQFKQQDLYQKSVELIKSVTFTNEADLAKLVNANSNSDLVKNNKMLQFINGINELSDKLKVKLDAADSKLTTLLAQYVDVRKEWKNRTFVPDANSTLRLTYGHVKGYSPVDATYYKPLTSLKGVLEKASSGNPDFKLSEKLLDAVKRRDWGSFFDATLNDVPVAILYDMDTTGGNSGSPVLDAYGNLVALNYDRAFEATINDYAWSSSYSRSIGVEIRYILWVTQKVCGADFILRELNVKS